MVTALGQKALGASSASQGAGGNSGGPNHSSAGEVLESVLMLLARLLAPLLATQQPAAFRIDAGRLKGFLLFISCLSF